MITHRFLQESDHNALKESLANDPYHKETSLEFFLEENTVCSVYEDGKGIVLFVRGKPIIHNNIGIIQLDIQYMNNNDAKRNIATMIEGFAELEQKAKENGFIGFFFNSDVPILKRFCIKRLGFEDYDDFLVKIFYKKSLDEVEEGMI